MTVWHTPVIRGEAPQPVLITAAGDIMLAGRAEEYLKEKALPCSYPFDALRPILGQGDIGFANLEGPVTLGGERVTDKTFTFRMEPQALDGIVGAGFTLFSIANNHILDYGPTGLSDTIRNIETHGANHSGAGMTITEARAPAFIRVKGVRVALLAYSATFPESFYAGPGTPGTAFPMEEFLDEDVPRAKSSSDLVIVSFHWGQELMETPKDYQRDLAHRAVDLGANIVFGHHPHVVQSIEVYHGGIIFYSLGNFAFGSYSEKVKDSIIARVFVTPGTRITAEVIPINVHNTEVLFQPRPLTGDRAHAVLEHLQRISQPLGTEILIVDGRGKIFGGKHGDMTVR